MRDIVAEAKGSWPSILAHLGIGDKALSGKHTACPMCAGKDRFRFDDQQGRGTWICSRCGAGDGFALIQRIRGIEFKAAIKVVEPLIGVAPKVEPKKEESDSKKMARIKRVWLESKPLERGDPVWKYLDRRCGITRAPEDVRYHPSLWYDEGRTFHAMVAVVRNPRGAPVSLHRTYLTGDGYKAPVDSPKKLMPGRSIKGAAIRLCERFASASDPLRQCLGIAEGIETALCAQHVYPPMPVWSCINALGIETFEPSTGPDCESVGLLTVFADNDENAVGQLAAFKLKQRMHERRIHVEVKIPPLEGGDWADVYERQRG